ncbi:MAG: class I SAM-dependent methyltransferase [Pseudomonadota bacterium]
MNWEAFFALHRDLPREGPGAPEDVAWALSMAETPDQALILDAACGPGADTEALARQRPQASILGVDTTPHFIEEARRRLHWTGPNVSFRVARMEEVPGSFDLIWCADAVYFMGVAECLKIWRPRLAERGVVAFSEPAWFTDKPAAELERFWQEYPAMTNVAGIEAQIADAGFRVVATRIVSDAGWEAYYGPMQTRIDMLRQGRVDPDLAEVLADGEKEAMIWRQYRDQFGYVLFVVRPA